MIETLLLRLTRRGFEELHTLESLALQQACPKARLAEPFLPRQSAVRRPDGRSIPEIKHYEFFAGARNYQFVRVTHVRDRRRPQSEFMHDSAGGGIDHEGVV